MHNGSKMPERVEREKNVVSKGENPQDFPGEMKSYNSSEPSKLAEPPKLEEPPKKTETPKKAERPGFPELPPKQRDELLAVLKDRFDKNNARHSGIVWDDVQARLKADPAKAWSLYEMERTGGEPDVVDHDKETGEYVFYDCSAESPKGRRSVCYDREALESRKEHRPANSAVDMAAAMGIELLTEEQYRELQKYGDFDIKTSSWVKTPAEIRRLGGAIFCDRRYNTVFVYHNGAESYYAARGFRGLLRV